MKRIYLCLIACLTVLAVLLSGCAGGQHDNEMQSSEQKTVSSDLQNDKESILQIRVGTDSESIVFALNDSSAAKSLYDQLPLTLPVEDYSTNEKIFYPPEELDVSNTPQAEGPAGTLAYYEPWGDVVMFYEVCNGANGLYLLGETISGTEQIENLSGEIRIEKVEDSAEEPSQNNTSVQSAESSSNPNVSSAAGDNSAPPSSSAQAGSEQSNTHSIPAEPAPPVSGTSQTPSTPTASAETEKNLQNIEITVNGKTFSATLNDNEAARAFAAMLPLTLEMSDYSGFEKVGSLGTSLPTNNSQTTTQSGDIVLYNGNQIVIFYGSNSWSYTRLGKVDDLSGWKDALGSGDVTVTFSLKQ